MNTAPATPSRLRSASAGSARLRPASAGSARRRLAVALLAVSAASFATGCFGRYPLTRKTFQYNVEVSKNEFNQNLVFWLFIGIPWYPSALVIDTFIMNPIEFWSGKTLDVELAGSPAPADPFARGFTDRQLQAIQRLSSPDGKAHLVLKKAGTNQYVMLGPFGTSEGNLRVDANGDILVESRDGVILRRLPTSQSAQVVPQTIPRR
jgi:hypothetical protein